MAIITISRLYGAGGTTFAKKLTEKLVYTYVDRDFCNKLGEETKNCLNYFDDDEEVMPSILEKIDELMTNRNFYKTNLYATIYSLALNDNVIFVGRGANLVLDSIPNVFSMQIVARKKDRIKAIADLKKINFNDALDLVDKMDHQRKNFIEDYFDKDILDQTLYHLVVNSSFIPYEAALEMVENYIKTFTKDDIAKSKNIIKKKLIEKKAEILLFGMKVVYKADIDFEMQDNGTLLVKGVISGEDEKQKLLTNLKKIDGVENIEDHLKIGVLSKLIY